MSLLRLADPEVGELDDIVDLERYPLSAPGSRQWKSLVRRCRRGLDTDGCLTLDGFLRPDALLTARTELASLATKASFHLKTASVYARTDAEADLPVDDPRRQLMASEVGHVTRDQIPPDAVVARLYVAPDFKRFVAACVGEPRVFEYADPLAGLIATVLAPGGSLSWHYDTNEYVVTVMTQKADTGGLFQYCRDLRSPGDENIAGLGRVLRGEAGDLIHTRDLVPGDLQIFLGRYSLHRVTAVSGETERHVAVLSYANRPGVIGPVDRTRAVYGRVTEAHLLAEEFALTAPDGLIL